MGSKLSELIGEAYQLAGEVSVHELAGEEEPGRREKQIRLLDILSVIIPDLLESDRSVDAVAIALFNHSNSHMYEMEMPLWRWLTPRIQERWRTKAKVAIDALRKI